MSAYFRNDYSETCHPAILKVLQEMAGKRYTGYGEDQCTAMAKNTIRNLISQENAEVYFLAGGTVSNVVAISSILRPHEAVISVDSGHIHVHETGAVEASGHKILSVPHQDGKILPKQIEAIVEDHQDPAKVMPKMVYLSQLTEYGTCYKKQELQAIAAVCQKLGLYLFIDGARLATALASEENDVTISEIAELSDLFYIGGTKLGCLFGEALVIVNRDLQEAFPWLIKNRAALLAKGFVTAAQLQRILQKMDIAEDTNDIHETMYYQLAQQANKQAGKIAKLFKDNGFACEFPVHGNLVFVRLPEEQMEGLRTADIIYEVENKNLCRFVTTYTTSDEEIEELAHALNG